MPFTRDQWGDWVHKEKEEFNYRQKYFDLRMLVKQLRTCETTGVEEDETLAEYANRRRSLQKLVDNFIKEEK